MRINMWMSRVGRLSSRKHICQFTTSSKQEMSVWTDIQDFRKARKQLQSQTIGFVPTMGGLHDGHLNLIRQARKDCDIVVASVFVNPTQFSTSDKDGGYAKYPQTLESDLPMLQLEGVDMVFAPTLEAMYPPGYRIYVDPEGYDDCPEGLCRPGFFRGVATIVTKLFNIVNPTHVYFGQKDAMQCSLIHQLIDDFHMDIEMIVVDTARELDGLAMSTRNQFLNSEERKAAKIVYQGLKLAKERVQSLPEGESISAKEISDQVRQVYQEERLVTSIEYISVASKPKMTELDVVNARDGAIVSVALFVGTRRLIDNIVI